MLKHRMVLAAGVVVVVGLICIGPAISQPRDEGAGDRTTRPRFDLAVIRQAMLDRMKEPLGASDEEWKALGPKVEKVMTLAFESRGMGRGMGRTGRGGSDRPAPEAQTETAKAAQALSKLLENKDAKTEDIKPALQALRDARAKAKADLEKAQKDLREILTVRQEAQLVMMSLLE